jgi:hypothetical protein
VNRGTIFFRPNMQQCLLSWKNWIWGANVSFPCFVVPSERRFSFSAMIGEGRPPPEALEY